MKKAFFLLFFLGLTLGLVAQPVSKVVVKKFSNGKSELVNHYRGAKVPDNLVKQESFSVDGKVIKLINFKAGKRDGVYQEFKEFDGTLTKELNYKEGKYDGTQSHFFSDGRVKFQLTYKGGKLDGPQREYFFKKDTLKAEHNYSGGIFHGTQKRLNKDGSKIYHYNFVAGKPDGIQRSWKGTEMTQETWVQGELEVITENWTASQVKIKEVYTFKNDGDSLNLKFTKELLQGVKYYQSGSIEAMLQPGEPPIIKELHPNGSTKGTGTGTFKAKEGKWVFYHVNGKKMMEGEFVAGKKQGVFRYWDEKERLIEEEVWNVGGTKKESWKVTSYHWNDKKKFEGSLNEEGYKIGIWKYWFELGEKFREETWKATCGGGVQRPVLEKFTEWTRAGKELLVGSEREELETVYYENGMVENLITKIYTKRDPCSIDPPERYVNRQFEKKIKHKDYTVFVKTKVISFSEKGDSVSVDRYNLEGKRNGFQTGWYPNGKKRYNYNYFEGRLQGTVQEWYTTGAKMMEHKYHSAKGGPAHLVKGVYYNEKGKDIEYDSEKGKPKKKSMLEIENASFLIEFMKMNPNE